MSRSDGVEATARRALFVYGSLIDTRTLADYVGHPLAEGADYVYTRLLGHRRTWGVATDNTDPTTAVVYFTADHAEEPAVQVLFLDVEEDAAAAVDGLLLIVESDSFERLREREGNYEVVDVTGRCRAATASVTAFAANPPTRILTFRGRERTRKAAARGLAAGTACIRADYLRAVEAGMDQHGWKDAFAAEPLPAPVRDLIREKRVSVGADS